MKLENIAIKKIISLIEDKELSLKDINNTNLLIKEKIYETLFKNDFKKWKTNIIPAHIDIESKFWEQVLISYPIFNINTFNSHYLDIFITRKDKEKVVIYQYHNPLWEIYYKKSLEFNSKFIFL